jgi:heme exporter protein C
MAQSMSRNDKLLLGLTVLTGLLMLTGLYMALGYAPTEVTMGAVQRVFYWHVPANWAGFLAFFVTLAASAVYLWKRDERADMVAMASAELGLWLLSMGIITGSIWARPVWNTWWTWDPRLTTATICWLAYVAYFMLRGALDDPERARRLSAVYGIVAFLTVPMTFLSISMLRTIHPNLFGSSDGAKGTFNMTPKMLQTLLFNIFTFTLLYGVLLWHRLRFERTRRLLDAVKARWAMS